MKHFSKLFFISLFAILSACQTIDHNGQLITLEEIKEINETNPSKEELVEMVGSPTFVPDYSANTWYYINRTSCKKVYTPKTVLSQQVVMINFIGNNAAEAKLVDTIENKDFTAEQSYTKTYGSEQTGIQKFVGNLGRFNASTKKNKKKKK